MTAPWIYGLCGLLVVAVIYYWWARKVSKS